MNVHNRKIVMCLLPRILATFQREEHYESDMKIEQLNQSMLLYFGAHTGIYWIYLGNKNEKENQLHKHIKQERAKLSKVKGFVQHNTDMTTAT
ncbi:hypothetical protein P5673_002045 [Acropora cervicornis]|uniref:Uncharacterized protein n=1 Tax=Acropora cervicornis TaxID=6130 RepID=A0AAD9VGH1_ACRCE|nr:hypothetical protein P5673_002045 [Acropora cervicornis]